MLTEKVTDKLSGLVGLPIQGTQIAHDFDILYAFLFWLSVFFFVLVVGAMLYFAFKYRASKSPKSKYITDDHLLEATWTIIPTVLLMVIFVWGYVVYKEMRDVPADAMEVRAVGKQWSWAFQYDDGRIEPNLYVPVNKAVKVIASSEDVIHGIYVPNFRVKTDVVPGMYTYIWFQTTVPGKHHLFCTAYCGGSHSLMEAKVVVLDEAKWADFRAGKKVDLSTIPTIGVGDDQLRMVSAAATPSINLVDQGRELVEKKGCVACHAATDEKKIGPGYKGVYGSQVELTDGTFVTADENYLKESIENPSAKVVTGFVAGTMPTYKGIVTEPEINAIIAYIKSLK